MTSKRYLFDYGTMIVAPTDALMLKLADTYEMAISLCDTVGIKYGNISEVSINTRAKSRWGQCRSYEDKSTINLSIELFSGNTDRGLMETMLHEICHSGYPSEGHKGGWLKSVNALNKAYGFNIKRCNSAEDKGFTPEDVKEKINKIKSESKYVFRCKDCGQMIYRQKFSRFVKYYPQYSCGVCRGRFEKVSC